MTTTTPATLPDEETKALTEYLAKRITGMHQICGHFVKTDATINDDGTITTITTDMTRRHFDGGDDCAIRVVLTLSAPEPILPAVVPDVISPRSAALLEISGVPA